MIKVEIRFKEQLFSHLTEPVFMHRCMSGINALLAEVYPETDSEDPPFVPTYHFERTSRHYDWLPTNIEVTCTTDNLAGSLVSLDTLASQIHDVVFAATKVTDLHTRRIMTIDVYIATTIVAQAGHRADQYQRRQHEVRLTRNTSPV